MPTYQFNQRTGKFEIAVPEPFYWGLLPWLWKRMTGWRDQYGRKAALFWEFDWDED